MEYTIVAGSGSADLIKKVNEHIRQGWTPTGGLAYFGVVILQAMIRTTAKP